ncbi:MAG TPA: hypothetical protein VFY93_02990 [Planctomycetota bacterium]|nr:hypothetical protein [Planctomycetota bacterium]
MGGVARVIREREKRNRPRRKPTWEILWLPATFFAFCAGAVLLPRWVSSWINALTWTCFGGAWSAFVVVIDRSLRRRRQRRTEMLAAAGVAREQPVAVRFPVYFTVYLVAEQLRPGDVPELVTYAFAGVTLLLGEAIQWIRWRRSEDARREQETTRLAEEF